MTGGAVTIKGVVHGKTVELERESGLPDGQQVSVTMKPAGESGTLPPGEGLKRAFGAWADDAADVEGSDRRRRNVPDLKAVPV
jgi:hypothetical protein